ncbi:alpha/beta fold hydrolase [Lacisediminihabitans profunda]|uniref:Alpha/beta hydrolase n=1 Tax=Lacisediminihabitans profunda TaxID=2594790 RepID=A0A5C8UJ56_9MICO|nr:alpha/beta hydrolase [Lacisediminihabitans profunda]TXN28365.1 alpha/beta hydrolase [Lacisediminihabitans profunda]
MSKVTAHSVDLDEVRLSYRRFGDGERLVVLVHGWPQTSTCWRHVMQGLGGEFTVVAPDLRGYGASGLATTGYDKRSTARDLHELLQHLGHASALVAGHDRGARVSHRWALDHPADIERLALLDILPTREVMAAVDVDSATRMWHWFFHRQPDLPEILLAGNTEPYLRYFFREPLEKGAIDDDALSEYLRAFEDPAHLAASLEDYRAGFGIDLERDDKDAAAGTVVTAALLLLWGADGGLRNDDVLGIWGRYASDVQGYAIPDCGHYLPEEQPGAVLGHLKEFFSAGP